ncbi:acetolactate synthase large subunit [Streptomyces rishiriensis]|uniref:acetolactate synthase large subunit n=1 Tax=Streptomyces rishiriensis TaxID=68264 RepID=UPI0033E8E296
MNPGTSELHLLAALEQTPDVRGVLCLFEGVATGAADGFGRMAGLPALTLLHQGAGLANGLANLHNAKRARTPVVNLVGDGATTHRGLGAPLESDVAALAGTVSCWVRTARDPASAGVDATEAVAATTSPPGGVATLIVPADVAWSSGGQAARQTPASPAPSTAREFAAVGRNTSVLLGGPALTARGLAAADRIARATHALVLAEAFPSRLEQGIGVPAIERLSSDPVTARRRLADCGHLVLAGAAPPITAFAEPGMAGELTPADCMVDRLDGDVVSALEDLADRVAPHIRAHVQEPTSARFHMPYEPLTADTVADVVATLLPEGAIVIDEANTSSVPLPEWAARHDVLTNPGFAIGLGMPLAVGAALACPDRPVVCLEADGSAMYTPSALWTQARERLSVTTIVLNNHGYAILRRESARLLGGTGGSTLFDLSGPDLDFVALAEAMGVPGCRVGTTGELAARLRQALDESGPHLIEASVPARY